MLFLNKDSFLKKKSAFMQKNNAFSTKSVLTAILTLVFVVIIGLSSAIIFINNQNTGAYSDNWLSKNTYISEPVETDAEGYIKITTPKQLAYISKYGNWSAKIRLYADIDLSGHNWVPITSFGGIFDGQGHKISNMYVATDDGLDRTDEDYRGLFSYLNGQSGGAIIKNIVFKNCRVYSSLYGGILAGYISNRANIKNIIIDNGTINVAYNKNLNKNSIYGGGLCGVLDVSTVTRCFINNTSVKVYSSEQSNKRDVYVHCGGIVGKSINNSIITVSYFSNGSSLNAANGSINYAWETYCGGIAGQQDGGTIDQCYNTGSVYGVATAYDNRMVKSYNGGIVGYLKNATITNCFNKGSVSGSASGYSSSQNIETSASTWVSYGQNYNKYNLEMANGATTASGYLGYYSDITEKGTKTITRRDCYNGGIVGYSYGTIKNSYNVGNISCNGYVDNGVVLYYKQRQTKKSYKYCFLLLKIEITYTQIYYSGNIVGYSSNSSNISNCNYRTRMTQTLPLRIYQYYYDDYFAGIRQIYGFGSNSTVASLSSWINNTNISSAWSEWYLLDNGNDIQPNQQHSYNTFFTINAFDKSKIRFCAQYSTSAGSNVGNIVEYASYNTGINYESVSGSTNSVYIDKNGFGNEGIIKYETTNSAGEAIWDVKTYINGGDPYIKDFYW